MTKDTTPTSGAADLPEALINIAREIEALKRDCGMDPESAIAIQNGRYMAISYKVRALAAGQATAAQAVAEPADTVVLNAAMRAIQQAIELIGTPTDERMRAVRRVLRGAVIVAEDDGKVAPLPSTAYAALPEPYCNAHNDADACYPDMFSEYQMRAFADATHALRASHGQAPAGEAILFEHEDGRYAINPDTVGDPAWHRLGPVDISALATPAQSGLTDAYAGAREDLSIWKKRALEAEALNHRFIADINGPTFVGEPAYSDSALLAREMYKSQDDSLPLCASDLQHSAIYDNHVEMQSCMRAVAERITDLAAGPLPAPPPAAQDAARKSITNKQIDRAIAELGLNYLADAHVTNRSVLQKLCRHAHGIAAQQGDKT